MNYLNEFLIIVTLRPLYILLQDTSKNTLNKASYVDREAHPQKKKYFRTQTFLLHLLKGPVTKRSFKQDRKMLYPEADGHT